MNQAYKNGGYAYRKCVLEVEWNTRSWREGRFRKRY